MLVELINHYLLGGEPEKAEVYLDAAIKQDPKNASFYRAKGTLYEKTERPAQAEEMYVKALELDPKDFLAQYNLGNIKLTEAINFHKKVQDIVSTNIIKNWKKFTSLMNLSFRILKKHWNSVRMKKIPW